MVINIRAGYGDKPGVFRTKRDGSTKRLIRLPVIRIDFLR